MDEQQLAEKCVDRMITEDGFSAWLGIELCEVKPGRAVVEMTVRPEMLNGFYVCHGGVPFSLADSALAFACNTHGRISVSIEANMAYPAKVVEGDRLRATAEEIAVTNSTGYYEVSVTKGDGTVVGIFRGTVYRTKKEFFPDSGA